jgi:uncharacterized RDD family membrane protein YckC
MALLQVKTPFNIELNFEVAAFHQRLFAWMIDCFLMYLYIMGVSWLLNRSISNIYANEFGIEELLISIPILLYHFLFELINKGQSIGKWLMHNHVVSLSGKSPSVSQLLLRWLTRSLDFGFFTGLFFLLNGEIVMGTLLSIASIVAFVFYVSNPKGQRLGDLIAGTTIVSTKLPYKLSDTIFMDLDMKSYQPIFPSVMRLSDKDINIIDNIAKHNNPTSVKNYMNSIAEKIKKVLQIETDMPSDMFLETLMRDYNYLSRK